MSMAEVEAEARDRVATLLASASQAARAAQKRAQKERGEYE